MFLVNLNIEEECTKCFWQILFNKSWYLHFTSSNYNSAIIIIIGIYDWDYGYGDINQRAKNKQKLKNICVKKKSRNIEARLVIKDHSCLLKAVKSNKCKLH